MRQIYPVQGPEFPVVTAATQGPVPAAVSALAALFGNGAAPGPATRPADRAWVRANMVTSSDGAAAVSGRSGGLSGPADRMVFTVLRSLTDAILVGSGTASAEQYRPVQAAELWTGLRPAGASVPAIAIVTASLRIDPDAALLTGAAADARTIVITTAAAPADRKAAIARHALIIEAGDQQVEVAAAVSALHDLGYRDILAEGGPTLLGQLADAGLVDELCVTTSPVLAAGPAGRIVNSAAAGTDPARLTLAHVLTDDSYLLSRYLCALPAKK